MSRQTAYASALMRDAWRKLRYPIVPSLVLCVIVAAAAVAVFATSGLALASQQRALDRLNSPEGRLVIVSDSNGNAGIDPRSIDIVETLSGVEWVIGIGSARTVEASLLPGGSTVTAREFFGSPPPVIEGLGDRQLLPGQAIAGSGVPQSLGFVDGSGHVTDGTFSADVVGEIRASAPLGSWNNEILVASFGQSQPTTLLVSVSDINQLQPVQLALRAAVIAESPSDLVFEIDDGLAALSQDVIDDLAASSRITVSALLALVALLVAAVQFGRVSGMAREIGRRRALGATRSAIVTSVLLSSGFAAAIGAVAGTAIGVGVTIAVAQAVPRWEFIVSIPVLLLLTALAGAVLPAVRASRLDPVAILRVP